MKYRKKPEVIEAIQWDASGPGNAAKVNEVQKFLGPYHFTQENGSLYLYVADGVIAIDDGWWIIKDDPITFRNCNPDIFEQTYEPAKAVTGTTGLVDVYVEALEGLGISLIDGQPMVCEQHPWRLWPHGDDDCAGPGMPLSAAEGAFGKIARFQ